jgi:uncharacterized membrane protein YbhN (UPF0104 family)
MTPSGSRALRATLAVCVSLAIVAALASQADVAVLAERWRDLRVGPLALASLMFVLLPTLRGLRFSTMTERKDRAITIAVVGIQNLMVRITPFRGGELVLPYLLSRFLGERVSRSLVLLVWVRLLEVWVLAGLCLLGLLSWFAAGHGRLVWSVALAFAVVSLPVLRFGALVRVALQAGAPVLRAVGLLRVARVQRFWASVGDVADEVERLGRWRTLAVFGWTVTIWAWQVLAFGLVLRSFAVDLPVWGVVLGVSFAQLAAAVPVASIGSVGTHEAGWVLGFGLAGLDTSTALASGIVVQFLTMLLAAAVALPSWLYLRARGVPAGVGAEG